MYQEDAANAAASLFRISHKTIFTTRGTEKQMHTRCSKAHKSMATAHTDRKWKKKPQSFWFF